MTISYYADRLNLSRLQQLHPEWAPPQLAAACGRSLAWIKKWRKRFRSELAAGKTLHEIAQGHSCARLHPPARTDPLIVERILDIRDHPPEGLQRTPGPKAILYYLPHNLDLWTATLPLPRSSRTIYAILKDHQRIAERRPVSRQPIERPDPLSSWQIDFKDVSTVQASPGGKQQHVVETLNIVDMGTRSRSWMRTCAPISPPRRLWRAWRRRCSPLGGPTRSRSIATRVGSAVLKAAISRSRLAALGGLSGH